MSSSIHRENVFFIAKINCKSLFIENFMSSVYVNIHGLSRPPHAFNTQQPYKNKQCTLLFHHIKCHNSSEVDLNWIAHWRRDREWSESRRGSRKQNNKTELFFPFVWGLLRKKNIDWRLEGGRIKQGDPQSLVITSFHFDPPSLTHSCFASAFVLLIFC